MSTRIRRTSLTLAALLAAVGLLAASAGAGMMSAGKTYGTHLYMSKKFPAFHGKIHSANAFCVADRKVKLYRIRSGPDKFLGADRSANNGAWKVKVKTLGSGAYYSRARRYGSASLGITCNADRSRIAVVD